MYASKKKKKKDQEEDSKTHLHQGRVNIENFLFCIFKVSYTLHFKRMPGGLVCNGSHPQPFLLGCASGEAHLPTSRSVPSTEFGQHLGRLACLPCGVPKRAQRHFGTSCPCWHLMPQLWPHALATQTFFALTLNFPAAKNLLPTEHIAILFCSSSQLNPQPLPLLINWVSTLPLYSRNWLNWDMFLVGNKCDTLSWFLQLPFSWALLAFVVSMAPIGTCQSFPG